MTTTDKQLDEVFNDLALSYALDYISIESKLERDIIDSKEHLERKAAVYKDAVNNAKQYLSAMMREVVDSGIIEYEKYGKCPACSAGMMYQCSCDSASYYVTRQQRQRATALGFNMKEEE